MVVSTSTTAASVVAVVVVAVMVVPGGGGGGGVGQVKNSVAKNCVQTFLCAIYPLGFKDWNWWHFPLKPWSHGAQLRR